MYLNVYIYRDIDNATVKSLATCLRHSEKTAQKTYDRRSKRRKVEKGLEFAKTSVNTVESMTEEAFGNGDFVACVGKASNKQPHIFIGTVYDKTQQGEYMLNTFTENNGIYVFEKGAGLWVEKACSMIPIEVKQTNLGYKVITKKKIILSRVQNIS